MPSEELRRRLEALNGGPLTDAPAGEGAERVPAGKRGSEPRAASARRRQARQTGEARARIAEGAPAAASRGPRSLEACLPGEARTAPGDRAYYHIERRAAECAPWPESLCADLRRALDGEALRARLRRITGIRPDQALFLDLETLGLRGQPLFLVGLLRLDGDGAAVCCQLLARSMAEEAGAIAAFGERLRGARLLVTYNGGSFDVPMLKDRASAHGIALPRFPSHLDLLPEARRRYRRALPNCRLQTLEQRLCGRARSGDIPGKEIPRVYREFVRTGDAARLAVVLQHNLLDLATTAELLARMWTG